MSRVRWRQVVLLYLVLAALAAEYWLVERRQTPAATNRPVRERFLPVAPDEVREIRLRRGGRRVEARRTGAQWAVLEPEDTPDDEFNRMDPAVSAPVVAWLASDEAQHVTGQVIRAVAENLIWMRGWTDGPTLSNGGKRWDATKLGRQLATDIFGTRAPGLRY